jgi:hypothetical protein
MFLRGKKVKDKQYLYAVENVWKKGKVKQKVKKYLGRVHIFEVKRRVSFEKFIEDVRKKDLENYLFYSDADEIVYDLIVWELYRRGFSIENKKASKGKLIANLKNRRKVLVCKGRPFCVKGKEGYINNLSINQILNAGHDEEEGDIDKKKAAFDFARLLVEGGINVPKDVFIELFHKKFLDYEQEEKEDNYIRY